MDSSETQQVERSPEIERPKFKLPKRLLHVFFGVAIFFGIAGMALTSRALFSAEDSLLNEIKNFSKDYLFYSLKASQGKVQLKGEENDRINVLLLGMGGEGHDGAQLTDTIIIASYKPSTEELSMFSLPRDLSIYIPNYAWRKINHLYYFGNLETPGNGPTFTMDFISKLLDIPLHYYVTVDFNSFKDIVNDLGGVDIVVEETLDDPLYPIKGRENAYPISSRYEHLYIPEGYTHMDGELALKFVRSRHAAGIEGSDFARSRRQQLVLRGLKEKALSANTILNPSTINALIKTVKEHIDTNLTFDEIMRMIGWARQFDSNNMITKVVDASPTGPLRENYYNGSFVLEPKTGDFSELAFIAQNIFYPDKTFDTTKRKIIETPLNESPPNEEVTREESATELGNSLPETTNLPTIEVRNGTLIPGFATDMADQLREAGFAITLIGNAANQNQTSSQVITLTTDKISPKVEDYFKNTFAVTEITQTIPDYLEESEADIVLILGSDAFYQ